MSYDRDANDVVSISSSRIAHNAAGGYINTPLVIDASLSHLVLLS